MCAIIDANVASEVFGSSPQPAGKEFLDWVNKGSGRLVSGGKLLQELESASPGFRQWAATAISAGKMRLANAGEVDSRTTELLRQQRCRSNDPHVIALAQVSGARLLYSNDTTLHADFKDRSLIDNPAGSVYTTNQGKSFTRARRRLLARKDLCRVDP